MVYFTSLLLFLNFSIASTVIPFERDVARVAKYSYWISSNASNGVIERFGGDKGGHEYWRGFSFVNEGPNDIVTTSPSELNHPFREFFFVNDDRAKRDTYLWITESNGSGKVSDLLETIIVFLPRENQMHIEEFGSHLSVTLTTGEEIVFADKEKTISSGVLIEKPLDLDPDRSTRKHVGIEYSGRGIMIRSEAKEADPRLAKSVSIIKKGLVPCNLPGRFIWTQEGFPKFQFISDEKAFDMILEKCGKNYLP